MNFKIFFGLSFFFLLIIIFRLIFLIIVEYCGLVRMEGLYKFVCVVDNVWVRLLELRLDEKMVDGCVENLLLMEFFCK